jgi:atypical dual specificity phosphatase
MHENEVHCLMGISRSATVVSAYLVATKKIPGANAIAFVQKKRPIACPNLGFRKQLDIYASRHLEGRSSEGSFSALGQIKAWTSAVKLGKGSSKVSVPES